MSNDLLCLSVNKIIFLFDKSSSSRLFLIHLLLHQLNKELLHEGEEEEADEVPEDDNGDVHGQGKPGIHSCHFGIGEEEKGDAFKDKSAPEQVDEDADHPRDPCSVADQPKDGSNADDAVDHDEPPPRPLDVGHQLS